MRRKIAGKRAVVTGASSGIGRALALELARQGASVLLVARRQQRLQEVAGEARELGQQVEYVVGDVTQPEVREKVLQSAVELWGGLDILINNAAVAALGRFDEASPERLGRIFDVNYFALVEMTRAALPLLARGNQPIIVNVGSILGHVAVPHLIEYCSAKFAVRAFTQVLQAELHGQIDALLVSPATVKTEIWERMIEQKAETLWRARRAATPSYIARCTVRAIRRGRREVLPGWAPKWIHFANRLSPALVSWVIRRRQ